LPIVFFANTRVELVHKHCGRGFVTVQPVKKGYSKALADGYLQEVKRLASNKNIHQPGRFQE